MATKPTLTANPAKSWLNRRGHPYPAIQLFIRIALIVSWIGLVAGVITGLLIFIGGLMTSRGFLSFSLMLLVWALSILWWIGFRVLPELLQVVLRIEDHLHALRSAGSPD